METPTKDEVAEKIAREHYAIDSAVTRIYRLASSPEREADPAEPIKLLEVYEYAIPSGQVVPLHFPPHPASGAHYSTEIAQIAPEELEQLQADRLKLPLDWQIQYEYDPTGSKRSPTP